MLSKNKDFRIVKTKHVAPYPEVYSMKGEEFTTLLGNLFLSGNLSSLPRNRAGTDSAGHDFQENQRFSQQGNPKQVFSPTGMSARSRVLEIEFGGFSGTDAAFESAVKSAASACNYLQGSSIVVRQDDKFFIKDGDQRRHALPSKVATRYRGVCHFARCTSGRLCLEPCWCH